MAASWPLTGFFRHKSIFPYEKVDGQVAGQLAANFLPSVAASWPPTVFFRRKSIFPYEKVDSQVAGQLAANFYQLAANTPGSRPAS
jgi:hypothetical protein